MNYKKSDFKKRGQFNNEREACNQITITRWRGRERHVTNFEHLCAKHSTGPLLFLSPLIWKPLKDTVVACRYLYRWNNSSMSQLIRGKPGIQNQVHMTVLVKFNCLQEITNRQKREIYWKGTYWEIENWDHLEKTRIEATDRVGVLAHYNSWLVQISKELLDK